MLVEFIRLVLGRAQRVVDSGCLVASSPRERLISSKRMDDKYYLAGIVTCLFSKGILNLILLLHFLFKDF